MPNHHYLRCTSMANKNNDSFPVGEISSWELNNQKTYSHVDKSVPERTYKIDYKNMNPYKKWQCHSCGRIDPPMHSEVKGTTTYLVCSNCEAYLDEHEEANAMQDTTREMERESAARGPKLVTINCPRCGSDLIETRCDAFVCLDCDAYIGGPDGLKARPRPAVVKEHPSGLVHRKMFEQVKDDLEEAQDFDYRGIPCRWCGQTGHVEVCLNCFEDERKRVATLAGSKDENNEE